MNHRDRLNEVAEKHNLPPLSGRLPPGDYCGYALDLVCIELGLLRADDLREAREKMWKWVLDGGTWP